jgi:hypothetical protein
MAAEDMAVEVCVAHMEPRDSMAGTEEDTEDITAATITGEVITAVLITEPDSIHTVTQGTGFPATGPKHAMHGAAVRSGYPAIVDIRVRAPEKGSRL